MSAFDHIGRGLKEKKTISFMFCTGPFHFWQARAYSGCWCLCGKQYFKKTLAEKAHHVIFGVEEHRTLGWWDRAEEEYMRKNGYMKRSEYEKTFVFDPITGRELQCTERGPADGSD